MAQKIVWWTAGVATAFIAILCLLALAIVDMRGLHAQLQKRDRTRGVAEINLLRADTMQLSRWLDAALMGTASKISCVVPSPTADPWFLPGSNLGSLQADPLTEADALPRAAIGAPQPDPASYLLDTRYGTSARRRLHPSVLQLFSEIQNRLSHVIPALLGTDSPSGGSGIVSDVAHALDDAASQASDLQQFLAQSVITLDAARSSANTSCQVVADVLSTGMTMVRTLKSSVAVLHQQVTLLGSGLGYLNVDVVAGASKGTALVSSRTSSVSRADGSTLLANGGNVWGWEMPNLVDRPFVSGVTDILRTCVVMEQDDIVAFAASLSAVVGSSSSSGAADLSDGKKTVGGSPPTPCASASIDPMARIVMKRVALQFDESLVYPSVSGLPPLAADIDTIQRSTRRDGAHASTYCSPFILDLAKKMTQGTSLGSIPSDLRDPLQKIIDTAERVMASSKTLTAVVQSALLVQQQQLRNAAAGNASSQRFWPSPSAFSRMGLVDTFQSDVSSLIEATLRVIATDVNTSHMFGAHYDRAMQSQQLDIDASAGDLAARITSAPSTLESNWFRLPSFMQDDDEYLLLLTAVVLTADIFGFFSCLALLLTLTLTMLRQRALSNKSRRIRADLRAATDQSQRLLNPLASSIQTCTVVGSEFGSLQEHPVRVSLKRAIQAVTTLSLKNMGDDAAAMASQQASQEQGGSGGGGGIADEETPPASIAVGQPLLQNSDGETASVRKTTGAPSKTKGGNLLSTMPRVVSELRREQDLEDFAVLFSQDGGNEDFFTRHEQITSWASQYAPFFAVTAMRAHRFWKGARWLTTSSRCVVGSIRATGAQLQAVQARTEQEAQRIDDNAVAAQQHQEQDTSAASGHSSWMRRKNFLEVFTSQKEDASTTRRRRNRSWLTEVHNSSDEAVEAKPKGGAQNAAQEATVTMLPRRPMARIAFTLRCLLGRVRPAVSQGCFGDLESVISSGGGPHSGNSGAQSASASVAMLSLLSPRAMVPVTPAAAATREGFVSSGPKLMTAASRKDTQSGTSVEPSIAAIPAVNNQVALVTVMGSNFSAMGATVTNILPFLGCGSVLGFPNTASLFPRLQSSGGGGSGMGAGGGGGGGGGGAYMSQMQRASAPTSEAAINPPSGGNANMFGAGSSATNALLSSMVTNLNKQGGPSGPASASPDAVDLPDADNGRRMTGASGVSNLLTRRQADIDFRPTGQHRLQLQYIKDFTAVNNTDSRRRSRSVSLAGFNDEVDFGPMGDDGPGGMGRFTEDRSMASDGGMGLSMLNGPPVVRTASPLEPPERFRRAMYLAFTAPIPPAVEWIQRLPSFNRSIVECRQRDLRSQLTMQPTFAGILSVDVSRLIPPALKNISLCCLQDDELAALTAAAYGVISGGAAGGGAAGGRGLLNNSNNINNMMLTASLRARNNLSLFPDEENKVRRTRGASSAAVLDDLTSTPHNTPEMLQAAIKIREFQKNRRRILESLLARTLNDMIGAIEVAANGTEGILVSSCGEGLGGSSSSGGGYVYHAAWNVVGPCSSPATHALATAIVLQRSLVQASIAAHHHLGLALSTLGKQYLQLKAEIVALTTPPAASPKKKKKKAQNDDVEMSPGSPTLPSNVTTDAMEDLPPMWRPDFVIFDSNRNVPVFGIVQGVVEAGVASSLRPLNPHETDGVPSDTAAMTSQMKELYQHSDYHAQICRRLGFTGSRSFSIFGPALLDAQALLAFGTAFGSNILLAGSAMDTIRKSVTRKHPLLSVPSVTMAGAAGGNNNNAASQELQHLIIRLAGAMPTAVQPWVMQSGTVPTAGGTAAQNAPTGSTTNATQQLLGQQMKQLRNQPMPLNSYWSHPEATIFGGWTEGTTVTPIAVVFDIAAMVKQEMNQPSHGQSIGMPSRTGGAAPHLAVSKVHSRLNEWHQLLAFVASKLEVVTTTQLVVTAGSGVVTPSNMVAAKRAAPTPAAASTSGMQTSAREGSMALPPNVSEAIASEQFQQGVQQAALDGIIEALREVERYGELMGQDAICGWLPPGCRQPVNMVTMPSGASAAGNAVVRRCQKFLGASPNAGAWDAIGPAPTDNEILSDAMMIATGTTPRAPPMWNAARGGPGMPTGFTVPNSVERQDPLLRLLRATLSRNAAVLQSIMLSHKEAATMMMTQNIASAGIKRSISNGALIV